MDPSVVLVVSVVVIGLITLAEAFALRRGIVAVHRIGIPLASWRHRLDLEIPPSIAPRPFPARDDIARSGGLEPDRHICVRWLGDHLLTFWRERHGWSLSIPMVSAFVVIERTPNAGSSTLAVSSRARLSPWLGLPLVLWWASFVGGPQAFPQVILLCGGFGALSIGISTWKAQRRVRSDFEELRDELVARAKTGEPWIRPEELEGAVSRSVFDLFH